MNLFQSLYPRRHTYEIKLTHVRFNEKSFHPDAPKSIIHKSKNLIQQYTNFPMVQEEHDFLVYLLLCEYKSSNHKPKPVLQEHQLNDSHKYALEYIRNYIYVPNIWNTICKFKKKFPFRACEDFILKCQHQKVQYYLDKSKHPYRLVSSINPSLKENHPGTLINVCLSYRRRTRRDVHKYVEDGKFHSKRKVLPTMDFYARGKNQIFDPKIGENLFINQMLFFVWFYEDGIWLAMEAMNWKTGKKSRRKDKSHHRRTTCVYPMIAEVRSCSLTDVKNTYKLFNATMPPMYNEESFQTPTEPSTPPYPPSTSSTNFPSFHTNPGNGEVPSTRGVDHK